MKKEKGITLISLVVTIIVLIILAAVSITLILGENGVINKAKQAKENMEIAAAEEAEMLNEVYVQIGTQTGPTTGSTTGGDSSTEEGNDDSKINDFKKAIADYIGEVAPALKPAYTADTETFGDSIKGIVKEVTKNATATEDNISEGKTAWKDGKIIIGNGEDVKKAYAEGYAAGQNSTGTIEYTYHIHGDGYCNETPIYHTHSGNSTSGGGCYGGQITCGTKVANDVDDGEIDEDQWLCKNGHYFSYNPGSYCPKVTGYKLNCGKTTSTIDSYKCTLTEDTIVSATIKYQ